MSPSNSYDDKRIENSDAVAKDCEISAKVVVLQRIPYLQRVIGEAPDSAEPVDVFPNIPTVCG